MTHNALALRTPRTRTRSNDNGHTLILHRGVQLPATNTRDETLARNSHLYFAYGADLCEPLLQRRCPNAQPLGRAMLGGFGLAFAGASKTWGGATLTLVPRARQHVDGVLYLMPDVSLETLDRIQGAPRVYQRVTVRIATDDDAVAEAHAYCMRPPLAGGRPTDAYFDLIAREYARLAIDPEPLVIALDNALSGAPLAR